MRLSFIGTLGCLAAAACTPTAQPDLNQSNADILDSCRPSRMMMILDRSSSMQTGTINGQTKWNIAVDAIDAIGAQFQNNLEMGLMAFPSQGQCSPGETLLQPALGRRDAIAGELSTPPPSSGNWTPMAQTLAAAQLEPSLQSNGGTGKPYALLITDGWQWCFPYDASTRSDPVDRVQELRDMGVTVYVVGFGDSVDARTLNLMAVAAGTDHPGCDVSGDSPTTANPCYYQADSPLQLQTALQDIVVTITGETCDGEDNDCDGHVDENLQRACSSDCGSGTETCENGNWLGCDAPPVETEVCDGVDNNCDNSIDPGCECNPNDVRACGSSLDVGECQPGRQVCLPSGQWGQCGGEVRPTLEQCDDKDHDCDGSNHDVDQVETCDGEDNDCDGQVDEDLVRSCSTACGLGEETCVNDNWVGCDAPAVETEVCDGVDNDCDTIVDNNCQCTPGETMSCGSSDVGECSKGVQTCEDDATWGDCEGEKGPTTEFCDGRDNDCDNKVDEAIETSSNDDVGVLCPQGDDNPEPPGQSDDPNPTTPDGIDKDPAGGVVSGCSTSGAGGGSWLMLLALVALGRRRQDQA